MKAAHALPGTARRPHLRRHLAFGRGNHACLGRSLALRETSIAVEELLRATAGIEVVEHRWSQNASMRSLASLTLLIKQPSGADR